VTFNAGLGDVLPDSVEANENSKINQPDAEYTGYELVGWFKEPGFINQWDFENDVVTANITLYAKWEAIPEGTPITTTLEFYNLASGLIQYAPGDHFYLKFDLDFSTFDWDASIWVGDAIPIHNFHFNGNGKKISNLDIE